MTLDRTLAPPFHNHTHLKLPLVGTLKVNGIQVYLFDDPTAEAFKMECVTRAGQKTAQHPAINQLSFKMLNEGTQKQSAFAFNNALDELGSFFKINPALDFSSLSLFGLSRFFEENLRLFSELIYEPAFDEKALARLKEKELSRLRLNEEKVSYLSAVQLRSHVFGVDHAYGRRLLKEDIEQATVEELRAFYTDYIRDFDVFLSGKLPQNIETLVGKYFSAPKTSVKPLLHYTPQPKLPLISSGEKYVQSSIHLGRRLFNRDHEDYASFMMMNEVLGGYFGSRLMRTIREEKGLTYGIYSALYPLALDGFFVIATEVNGDKTQETVEAIRHEIEQLQQTLVSNEELETARNYMIGSFINSFSGAFSEIDKFKTLQTNGLEMSFYTKYLEDLQQVTPKQIQEMANRYLSWTDLTLSIAGPKTA